MDENLGGEYKTLCKMQVSQRDYFDFISLRSCHLS